MLMLLLARAVLLLHRLAERSVNLPVHVNRQLHGL
jgi:hypothetical protein